MSTLGTRTNIGQLTTCTKYYGDSKKWKRQRGRTTGKGGVWASQYHDMDKDMETYRPVVTSPPRG